ncbi:MAG: polysaccharide deacetylase [Oscillospiraceae bacterium]|nr:polysaccharide deacetylase [Oscillospiraceae bacterium]
MKGYIGSVRFFKNLILLFVVIFITVPTVFAFLYRGKFKALEAETAAQVQQLNDKIAALETQLATPSIDPDGPAYQSLYPDFYAPQALNAKTHAGSTIYLTFDDGPSYRTPEVLQILREENVKATFFVIGHSDEQSRQWMRDIVADGHTIAMHTYSHDYDDIYASVEDYLADMYEIFTLIKDATGVTPTAFRFPGGSINGYNYEVSQDIISEMLRRGFVPYDWNISSGDAASSDLTPAGTIVSNVVGGASGISRGIVLMHDAAPKYTTVEALRPMIQNLRDMGFTFDCIHSDTAPILYGYSY